MHVSRLEDILTHTVQKTDEYSCIVKEDTPSAFLVCMSVRIQLIYSASFMTVTRPVGLSWAAKHQQLLCLCTQLSRAASAFACCAMLTAKVISQVA